MAPRSDSSYQSVGLSAGLNSTLQGHIERGGEFRSYSMLHTTVGKRGGEFIELLQMRLPMVVVVHGPIPRRRQSTVAHPHPCSAVGLHQGRPHLLSLKAGSCPMGPRSLPVTISRAPLGSHRELRCAKPARPWHMCECARELGACAGHSTDSGTESAKTGYQYCMQPYSTGTVVHASA